MNIENSSSIEVINAVVDPLSINGNTTINGNLEVTGVITADLIDPIHSVNEITNLDNPDILISAPINMNNNNINNCDILDAKGIIINADDAPVKSAQHQLHIQDDNGDCKVFLESTTSGGDNFIDFSQQFRQVAAQIRHRWGPIGNMQYRTGQLTNNWGIHEFFVSTVSATAKGIMPTFSNDKLIASFGGSGTLRINFYNDINCHNVNISNVNNLELETITANTTNVAFNSSINMQSNDILGANNINTSSLSSITGAGGNVAVLSDLNMGNNDINDVGTFRFQTTPNLDNTETRLLCLNTGDDVIEYREISSLNPFNQTLNTTDNVTFNNITANDLININRLTIQEIGGLTTGNILYFENDGSAVRVEPGCQLQATDIISDMYRINNGNNHVASYSLTRSLSSNTDTILTNWNVIQTSPYINVDPITGIFSPEEGIYSLLYNHVSDHTFANAYIGARLTLLNGQTVYQSIQQSNDLFLAETGFEASQYESLTGFFDGINQYQIRAKMSANSAVSVFNVTIIRLF